MRPRETTAATWLLLLLSFHSSKAQIDCFSAPEAGRRIICQQIKKWADDARKAPAASSPDKDSDGVRTPETIYDCMTLECICRYTSGVCPGKSVRKDYRLMTDVEREQYHGAFWALKWNGDYPIFSRIHEQAQTSPGAHSGPAFFPWHREYMKRIEIALRRINPSLPGLPYWDSTLDQGLPDPTDSVMFGDELMGRNGPDGSVRTGAFGNWTIPDGSRVFTRDIGDMSALMTNNDLSDVNSLRTVVEFLAFTAPMRSCPYPASWDAPEFVHGMPHVWAGGDMLLTRTSTFDPMFFLHHSFVDLMWENWRLLRQTRAAREIEYPPSDPDCATAAHFAQTQMIPFNKRNVDGLSNDYTDNLISYGPRATCTSRNQDCGSKYLFCDVSHGSPRCVSKARIDGKCNGFTNGEDVCYGGQCIGGVCRVSDTPPPTTTTRATTTTTRSTTTTTTTRPTTTTTRRTTTTTEPTTTTTRRTTTTTKPTTTTRRTTTTFRPTTTTTRRTTTTTEPTTTTTRRTTTATEPTTTTTRRRTTTTFKPTTTTTRRTTTTFRPTTTTTRKPTWPTRPTKTTKPYPTTRTTHGYPTTPPDVYPTQPDTYPISPSTAPPASELCFNDHFCCGYWESTGACSAYPDYMQNKCKASCSVCRPSFDIYTECSDRSNSCPQLVGLMGCESEWMGENCRKFCGMCAATREQQCTVGFTWDLTPPEPKDLCLNTHFCCMGWSALGYCSKPDYFDFMTMYCGPSCGRCKQKHPHPLWSNSNDCVDFVPNCAELASQGKCTTKSNKVYMKENCKHTCGSCDVLDFKTRMAQCGLNRGMTFMQLVLGGELAM